MTAAKPPAFQFYPKDWDTDVNVIPMTYEEEGVYFALCRRYWLNGNTLPNNLDQLRALLKGFPSKKKMDAWWLRIGHCFIVTGDGLRLQHKKLDAIRAEQIANKKNRQDAAAARWGRPKKDSNASAAADALQCSSSSSASSSAEERETAPSQRRVQGHGAFEPGSLPRDHMHHAVCGGQMRLCLSYKVFGKFVGWYGGPKDDAETAIRQFVDALEVANTGIGDYRWLEDHFTAFLRTHGRLKDAPVAPVDPPAANAAHDKKIRDMEAGVYGR